jgi:ribonuclease HI
MISSDTPRDITIYTDAGVRNGRSAISCIICNLTENEFKIAALIDLTTNVEAEATALFLALLAVKHSTSEKTNQTIHWHTDCLTLIKNESANEINSLDNFQNLLRNKIETLFPLIEIVSSHIKAHSGNKKNEQCDKACTWLCESGTKLLKKHGEGPVGRLKELDPRNAWHIIDIRGKTNSFEQFDCTIKEKIANLKETTRGIIG